MIIIVTVWEITIITRANTILTIHTIKHLCISLSPKFNATHKTHNNQVLPQNQREATGQTNLIQILSRSPSFVL